MRLRRKILIGCMVVMSVLFIDGICLLTILGNRTGERYNGRVSLTRTESTQEVRTPVQERSLNIAVFGLDEEEVRSDVILLLNFSPKDGSLNILSVARDTKVTAKGKTAKINAMIGMGGERLAVEKLEEMTGLPVDYYLTLNFMGFRKIIDTLDGVQFNVPINMDYDDPEQNLHIHLTKGLQLLNGDKAEQFVRYRKGNRNGQGYTDGDIGRIGAQQEFIKALIDQKVRLQYLAKADDIYFILKRYMKTNIEIGDFNRNLKYLRDIKYEKIKAFTLPGEPDYVKNVWYFIYDPKKTQELIDNNFSK